jgi:uridine kinase
MSKEYDLTLSHPSRMIIYGPSGSGKSTFCENLMYYMKEMFGFYFDFILYCSGQSFPSFDSIHGINIQKINSINETIIDSLNENFNNLIILDDNMHNIVNDIIISDLFTKKSHHKNITVIILFLNLFPKSKYIRDISSNSTYIVLMANPREILQIKTLGIQIDGANSNFIVKAYKDATKNKPYSYLFLDFNQNTDESIRVRTNIFPHEEPKFVYVKLAEV